jgi:hypothetical protein
MDLTHLTERIHAARDFRDRPFEPGETERPILGLTEYMAEEDHVELRRAVRALRRKHPDSFGLYHENAVAILMIDVLEQAESTPTLEQVGAAIAERQDDRGPWLISIPLANVETNEPALELHEGVVLCPAVLDTEWLKDRWANSDADIEINFALRKLLGDDLSRPTRWIQPPGEAPVDTRRTATILFVEEGSPLLAVAHAQARAQYALAVWPILSPPKGNQLLPELGIWAPQPWLHMREGYKRFKSSEGRRPGRVGRFVEYRLPAVELLRIPFGAMAHRDRRSAQALLSSSLALVQASRESKLQLSERVRAIQVAIETLCEAETRNEVEKRWLALSRAFDVEGHLGKLGYDADDITEIQQRLSSARNIATHGSDAVLLDLGWPSDAPKRKMLGKRPDLSAGDLAYSGLTADLTPLISAVRHVLRSLFQQMNEHDWDDKVFDALLHG